MRIILFLLFQISAGVPLPINLDHQLSSASKLLSLVSHYLLQANFLSSVCLSPFVEIVVRLVQVMLVHPFPLSLSPCEALCLVCGRRIGETSKGGGEG